MRRSSREPWTQLTLAAVLLSAGWVFYLAVRGVDLLRLVPAPRALTGSASAWPAALAGSAPSVLHALAALCLFRAVCRRRRDLWLLWGLSTLGFELLQALAPALGRFDPLDLAAIAIVALAGALVTRRSGRPLGVGGRRAQLAGVLAASAAALATSTAHPYRQTHVPICMPLADLRASFAVEPPRALTKAGKITRNDRLLLVSEPMQGVHVFDNGNPEAPVPVAFLKILGNTDVALTDQYLYADSFVDLLTIKFDGNTASLVGRQEGVLSPRLPKSIDSDADFRIASQETEKCLASGGAVVGYERREDGDQLEKKIEENKRD